MVPAGGTSFVSLALFPVRTSGLLLGVLGLVALVLATASNPRLSALFLAGAAGVLGFLALLGLGWWLRRRKECGRPCQTCAHDCEVRAIRPTGEINANECHYCLDCQVTYYSDRRCMPLIERRLKREQRSKLIHIKPADAPRK